MSELRRFGSYFLLKKIATGGMAELYKAKKPGEKGFEKLLAIKMILPHLASNEEFTSMFIDEAKVAALLNQHNIVQIYDLGRIEDSYCIVMEYVRGKDLRSVISRAIKNRAPIRVEHACLITASVLAGLGYAHRKKEKGKDLHIVHRDISPQNVLISYEGEVKIVDFGIAKAATQSRDTQAGVLKGKLSYMSPEQAHGKPTDMRSDVFSAGVVFYEMLTGRRLFQGDTDIATLEKVRSARVEPLPTSLSKNFPSRLEEILLKSLAKEPDLRYQSAAEMEAELLEFMRGAGYSTSGYSLSEYMHKLFADEIEQEAREEQELDGVVAAEALVKETVVGTLGASKPAAAAPKKTATTPSKTTATAPSIAASPPSQRASGGRGGLIIAVVAVVALALGAVWLGSNMMSKRRAARPVLPAAQTNSPPAAETSAEAPPPETPAVSEQPAQPAGEEVAAETVLTPEPDKDARPPEQAAAVIGSEPAGAQAYVDGRPVGRTPVRMSGLEPDVAHEVRLGLEGYDDWSGSFRAKPGEAASVRAVMKPATFSVDVSSEPPGARVQLDGRDTGKTTPARLDGLKPGGSYKVNIELEGYAPYENTLNIKGSGTQGLRAELVQLFGSLTINSRPWAFVFVDGDKKGMTPLAGISLAVGEHEVALSNPKLNLKKLIRVRIKPDEITRIVIDLDNK